MPDTPPVPPQGPPDARPAQPWAGGLDILRFLVEVFAVVTFALWGFLAWPFPWNVVLGVATPLLAILVWALFVSPKAVIRTHPFVQAIVELMIFAGATIAWWSMGQVWVGIVLAILAVTTGVLTGRRRLP